MADVQPFAGIRYQDSAALADLVTPPYDVISSEAQARYYDRHPENIIRLELGRETPRDNALDDRYTRAAVTFAEWRLRGVLRQDAPALYVYEQRFTALGATHTRVSLLGRVRLEPWEAGVVLPHERTLSKPKDDRLKLLRASAANLSPILSLYDDPKGQMAKRLAKVRRGQPAVAFADEAGEEHRLWLVKDAAMTAQVAAFFAPARLYIADGHHRYETALAYRDELRAIRRGLEVGDSANFVMMALAAVEDPGLVVLPTHRLLHDVSPERLAALDTTLAQWFESETLASTEPADWLARLDQAGAGEAGTALVVVRPEGSALWRLTAAGRRAMHGPAVAELASADSDDAAGPSDAWRALDVVVAHALVLGQALDIDAAAVAAGGRVTYTRDAAAAASAVRGGHASLALLLNPTPPTAIRDVALAGDRMPQKSTYFYPKLITGLTINPLW
ncbi:MAG TPA: DUF1015 domain-containing protein [Ktedonobacterales bacterium]|nr:DUF1015 domain-containing protein [Ktedonobacterales bacterium]